MKPHLPLLLLSSLLSALSASAVSTTFLSDGVDETDLAHSERFYDVGKGYYWQGTGDLPYRGAQELYNANGRSFSFLGNLAPRISGTTFGTNTFKNLQADGNTCGYQVPANQIQYWLSYYGVFYTGEEPLAYGLTYSNDYLEKLGGTQSLSVGMLFYDTWKDAANNLAVVGDWYFRGTPDDLLRNPTVSSGGYFADYFNDQGAVIYLNFTDEVIHANDCPLGVRSFTHELAKAFALEEEADGTYSSLHPGQVAYLGLVADGKNAGHALTCYGFETDERGMLRSLKVTNSDDKAFALLTLYVKEDSRGYLYLYKDAACTDLWEYSSSNWYIQGLEYINTPEHLVDLYHLYNAEDTPLTWTGTIPNWSSAYQESAAESLPTAETGWDVVIAGVGYHSFFSPLRPLCFDDSADSTEVHLVDLAKSGAFSPVEMRLNNSMKDYLFVGSSGTRLQPESLIIDGTGAATFRQLLLATGEISYETYTLNMAEGARLTATTGSVQQHGVLELSGGSVNIPTLSFSKNATLRVSALSTLTGAVTMQGGSVFDCILTEVNSTSALLSVTGSLTLYGTVKLEIEGTGLSEGERYRVCTVTQGNINTADFYTEHGSLSFSDNTLWLTYREVPAYTWSGGNGTWSSTVFGTTSHNTVHADISFERGRGTISLVGKVTPHHVMINGGSYTFAGSGASIDCAGYVNLYGSANLTLDVPVTAQGIILEDEATLTLETGQNSVLNYLSAAEHTHLNFRGAVTYELDDAGVLAGDISVGAGTVLDFHLVHDEYLEGEVTAVSSAAALRFENASDKRDIVIYEAGDNLEHFIGSVYVGSDGAAHHTTLSLDAAPRVGQYILSASGVLALNDDCELATSVSGTGTLVIGAGAVMKAAVNDGLTTFAPTVALDVQGSLEVGTISNRLNRELARDISISGHLTAHVKDGLSLHLNSLTLNGGTYTYLTANERGDVTHNIETLSVGKKGGTISRIVETQNSYGYYAGDMQIGSITGSGNLFLHGDHFFQMTYYAINGVGADGYTGDIHVDNVGTYYDTTYHLTVLELGTGVYGGRAMVSNSVDNDYSRSALGISGDVSMLGLESEDWGQAYLYSGYLEHKHLNAESPSPVDMIVKEAHTLRLTGSKDYHFYGDVLESLSLEKSGSGTQSFRGDMSAFNGSLSVYEGTLAFSQNISPASIYLEGEGCLQADARMELRGALTMDGGKLIASALSTNAASFCGNASVQADSIEASGAWTLNVSMDNLHDALLKLLSRGGDGSLNLTSLDIRYQTAEVASSSYRLLTLSQDYASQLKDVSILCNGGALRIGDAGSSPLYLENGLDGCHLMLTISDGTAPLPRGESSLLVWQAPAGTWSVGTGELSGTWESEHENANFHDGDEVVFASAAIVTISGNVAPGDISVCNESGMVTLQADTAAKSGISGNTALTKSAEGALLMASANTYTGGTTVSGGSLTVGHAAALGTGDIKLSGGTLNLGNYAVTNKVTATGGTFSGTAYAGALTIDGEVTLGAPLCASSLSLKGGTLHGDITSRQGFVLNASGGRLDGALTLDGGTLNIGSTPLEVSGALTLSGITSLGGLNSYSAVGTYTLVSASSIIGHDDMLSYGRRNGRRGYEVSISGNELMLTVTQLANELTWTDAKGTWTAGCRIGGTAFETGDIVNFRSAAAVTISGRVAPGEIIVDSAANVSFTADKKVYGSGISGEGSVTKSGAGVLTMNEGNTYSGGTVLNAGTLKATADDSFGTGDIVINGGTLDLGSKAVANDIVLSGTATLKGDAKYVGNVSVDGNATLLAKTSYTGTTTIDSGSTLTLAAAATMAGSIVVDGGTLCITAPKGMTLAKNKTLILSSGGTVSGLLTIGTGSTLVWADGSFAAAPVLSGGTLDLGGSKTLMLTGAKAQVQFGDRSVDLLAKSYVKSEESLLVKGGTVTVNDFGGSSAELIVSGGTLTLSTGKLASANTIRVTGDAAVVNGATHSGAIIVEGTLTKAANIKLTAASQRVELNGSGAMLGSIAGTGIVEVNGSVDITSGKLSNTNILLNGTLTHAKGWTLAKGQTLTLGGGSMNGMLTIGAGAVLDMNGYSLPDAPVLKGGTADMGGTHTLTLTGNKGVIGMDSQDFSLMAKSFVKSDDSLIVKGGAVTVNDFGGSSAEVVVSGGTLTLSTGKLASANTIRVTGDAAVVNGATHSGAIIVEGSLTKATNIKLTAASQRVELNGSGAMLGSIAGTGIVEVNGSVDITSGKLSNTNILLNGTLTHAKGWTLAKGQTLTLGGGSMNGMLTIGAGAVLDMNGYSLPDAPVLKGGTADMGGAHTLTLTGNKGVIGMDGQDFSLMAKSFVKSDDSLIVKGGAVTVNDFGGSSAELVVSGGTLTLSTGKLASANTIRVTGDAAVVNGATHSGAIIVEGSLTKATNIKLTDATQRVELNGSGAMLGGIAGTGVVEVNGSVDITSGKLSNTNILLNGTLTHAKGWTLAKGQTLTLGGGSMNGMLTIGAGAVLDMNGYSLPDAPVLKGGTADMGGTHTLTLTGNKGVIGMDGQDFSLMAKSLVKSDDSLIVKGGAVTVNDFGGSSAEVVVSGGTLTLSTGKLASTNTIRVTGDAAVVNGATHSGAIIVEGSLTKATNIKLTDATQRVSLNGEGTLLGTIAGTGIVDVNASIDATAARITATRLNLNNGLFTNTKGLAVAKGQTLTLAGAALNLGPKGTLSTAVGSTLVVSSATTLTGNLTFGGGELVFAGGTLDVSGTLTLSKPMTVTNGGVITYGTLKPFRGDIAALFGGADVELDEETCTITFNGGVARRTRSVSSPLATAAEAPVMAAALDAAPAPLILLPETNPVADAMVQADWGIIDAERAFMGAVNTRHQHAALLDKGRGAAWVSAFGSAVRHGSKGAHHGSDGNIEGAAFGLEHAVSETGSLGLAIGRSKNRLSATGVTHLRQETAHVSLYGQTHLAHGFTADAAASYGDTETKLGSASWTQKSATLTARLTHAQQVPDATALAFRTFGGLAYEATDAGSIGSAHTGSVQNLRAELGAGITHTAGKAHLYAEAALTGDLLRHNPTADLDGFRTHGANPGRIGLRATVGGLYEFTDTWSGTASYGIETESRSTSHTFNVGVSKSF